MRKRARADRDPGEHEARERSWAVVRAAFAEREPSPRRRSWKPVAAIALALVVVAGLLSPPGRAVLDEVREVVGVEQAQPALFSLPAPGRLLVTSDAGAWVVERGRLEAAARRLPRGVLVAVRPLRRRARRNELVALEPDGDVRWTLARPDVRFPRWGGTQTDTRIAYLSRGRLRVVAGDGKGDRLLDEPQPHGRPCGARSTTTRSCMPAATGPCRVVERRHEGRPRPRCTRDAPHLPAHRRRDRPARGEVGALRRREGARPTAAGSQSAGPMRTSSSSSARAAGTRSERSRTSRSSSAREPSRASRDGAAGADRAPVDSSHVLARGRQGDGARGAARGRAGAAPLLPLRLVADLNAGAAASA